ncbi:nuclear transport factor 2 family protein [Sphingomonas parapaucimobilis]|uniref:nuclear transport factor 2 family protein n=1 Tax=Sphingomonas TaxID=13687 RepID=UPI00130187A2|nr:nuclear transport factor 2 family protein [Sphingomonas sp. Sph1(2015)]
MSSLADSTTAFMSTFNGGEFDRMVSLLSPDAVYVDPAGAEHSGVDAIGASLKSIFDGSLGSVSYDVSSTILDESDQRALVTWTMVMTAADGSVSSVDGLDILRFEAGRLVSKNAFCKAEALAIRSVS